MAERSDPPSPPLAGILRSFWRRLTGGAPARPPPQTLPPRRRAAWRKAAWGQAEGAIRWIEGATPPLDAPAERFEQLCTALGNDVARLRAAPPRTASGGAGPREIAARRERARDPIREAGEMVEAMAAEGQGAAHTAEEWERRAMMAVKAGVDELAREALARRAEAAGLHRRLEAGVNAGRAVLAEMEAALTQLT